MAHVVYKEAGAPFYRFGAGIHSGVVPQDGADFLQRASVSGTMFNTYGIGGYLIWRLWPEKKVFIDGREDLYYSAGVLQEYMDRFNSSEHWSRLVDRYDIDFAILNYPETVPTSREKSPEILAFPRSEWALVYFDDVVTIYLRRNRGNGEVIREYEIQLVQPLQRSSYMDAIIDDAAKLEQFLAEMAVQLRAHPNSFRAHFTLGVLSMKRGREHLGEAIEQFRRSIAVNPDFAPAYQNLGNIYLFRGQLAEAERMFRKALSLGKSAAAEEGLQRVRQLR
jgi:tetratricopeptide (TPR) repeat protein